MIVLGFVLLIIINCTVKVILHIFYIYLYFIELPINSNLIKKLKYPSI